MKRIILLLLITSLTLAAPSSEKYGELLSYAVCETGVNYQKLTGSDHVAEAEKEFLALSKKEFVSLNESEQIAWYSNLYNFYTIKLIVDNYPVKGIQEIGSPWDKKIIPLWGKKISLNHLEHQIIRKDFDEPRVHFALNCASIGCPPVRLEPFTGDKLSAELDAQAEAFLTDETRNRVDGKTLYLSKIFQWYGDDFKGKYGGYVEYVKSELYIEGKVKVKFLDYDWNLNEATCGGGK